MGVSRSRDVCKLRHVIWCDTEGGVRGVKLWDITCIEETTNGVRAQRLCSPSNATKRGRAQLRNELPNAVYRDSVKSGSTCVVQYNDKLDATEHSNVGAPLETLLASYLHSRAGSVLVAWNLRGHDKHVLKRAVGNDAVDKMVLWDALPWFRSKYSLPKNTMSSNKVGTPRAVFNVPTRGSAHSSFADAAHMRDVVLRAAYAIRADGGAGKIDIASYRAATRSEQYAAARAEIEETVALAEWHEVVDKAWSDGMVPASVYEVAHT